MYFADREMKLDGQSVCSFKILKTCLIFDHSNFIGEVTSPLSPQSNNQFHRTKEGKQKREGGNPSRKKSLRKMCQQKKCKNFFSLLMLCPLARESFFENEFLVRMKKKTEIQEALRAERAKGKKQLDITIDFNSLQGNMYQQVPPHCVMCNIDGGIGGISPYFRSALFYVDSNPPPATVFKDYAGQFGKAVLETKNAVLVFCTKEKANHFCDKVHLTPDNHCPANINHKDNPTWKFEFMDNNMPPQASFYLVQIFDIKNQAKRIRAAASSG